MHRIGLKRDNSNFTRSVNLSQKDVEVKSMEELVGLIDEERRELRRGECPCEFDLICTMCLR